MIGGSRAARRILDAQAADRDVESLVQLLAGHAGTAGMR